MFEVDRLYPPSDPALRPIASLPTLARWRHEKRGPRYRKFGSRVAYLGRDLNEYIAASAVETADSHAAA